MIDLDFDQKVSAWEKRIEDVLIEVAKDKIYGTHLGVDITPVIDGFNKVIKDLRAARVNAESRISKAALIAAAPDLLDALQEVVLISDRKHDAWDRAKAAITKALGRR